MAVKIPARASLSSPSQQKGRTGCGALGAFRVAVRHCSLSPETQHASQAGKARPQRWPAFLRRRVGSVFGWSLLLLLVLQITCISTAVSCEGAAGARGQTAGVSSYPRPRFGTRLGRRMRKQERCPNSSGILGWLVARGMTSRWLPALGPDPRGFHTDAGQEAGVGSPGRIRATEALGLATWYFRTEGTLLSTINSLKSLFSYQAGWERSRFSRGTRVASGPGGFSSHGFWTTEQKENVTSLQSFQQQLLVLSFTIKQWKHHKKKNVQSKAFQYKKKKKTKFPVLVTEKCFQGRHC